VALVRQLHRFYESVPLSEQAGLAMGEYVIK
jgi:hypothetical protein